MDIQMITLLIAILSLVCFLGTMYGIQALVKQGRDPGKQLQVFTWRGTITFALNQRSPRQKHSPPPKRA